MTTTPTRSHPVERLFRDEYFDTLCHLAHQGRLIIVAASSITSASYLQHELQLREGLPPVTRFVLANGNEAIDLDNGGRIIFTSTASGRIHAFAADAVFLDHRASEDYRVAAVVALSKSEHGQLFEIDA